MDGFIVVDKPEGMTSHDVVNLVRRLTGQKKVGHTGTLDPFATGVLPIALGEGTKAIPFLDESVKEYQGVMVLGKTTDTQDCTGEIVSEREWRQVRPEEVILLARAFTGSISQIPPMYSAVKHKGTPLYRLARKGKHVDRQPRAAEIFSFSIDSVALPEVVFTVRCSRGTYVRTLAGDLGEKAGCGAHLLSLRRTRSGIFSIDEALTVERLKTLAGSGEIARRLISPNDALQQLVDVRLTEDGSAKINNGIIPPFGEMVGFDAGLHAGDKVRLSHHGKLKAVAEIGCGNDSSPAAPLFIARLLRVFNQHGQESMTN